MIGLTGWHGTAVVLQSERVIILTFAKDNTQLQYFLVQHHLPALNK